MRKHTLNRLLSAALACGLALGTFSLVWSSSTPALAQGTKAADDAKTGKKVILIFRNGNRVEATLLSETDSSVHVRVTVAGITSETDYRKSDILKIEDVKPDKDDAPKTDSPKPDATKPDAKKPDASKPDDTKPDDTKTDAAPDLSGLVEEAGLSWGDQSWRITSRAVPSEANGPKVYMIYMGGEFGRDESFTPMKEVVQDVKKYQPDILVLFFNNDFTHYGEEKEDFEADRSAFDQLEQAREMATLFVDGINNDSSWAKKPRIVSWIRKAMGGAAFLPFIAKEMYYTPDAIHGGIGRIEHIFDGVGDERARQKQYSLRQARGEGLCELGGHEKLIMRAMARTDFVLSYRMKDGKPEFLPGEYPKSPDEILLTDDGKDDRRDIGQDVLRGRGNDTLTLDADTALRLQLSSGTAETLDDLMDRMGVSRNYVLVKGKGAQILRDWSRQIGQAEANILRLSGQLREVRVREPNNYQNRTRARGEQKHILLHMRSIYSRYAEALNPARVGGAQNSINQIDELLQNIEAAQLADKPD